MTQTEIEQKYYAPGAYWAGNEYWTKNPWRADSHIGSFSINVETGLWYDFATGSGGSLNERKFQPTKEYLTVEEFKALKGDFVTPYRDLKGNILFAVVRFNNGKDGKKVIYPVSKCNGEIVKRIPKWLDARPMTRVEKLDAPVLVVEGEKCFHRAWDYARRNNFKINIVTWHGGAGQAGNIDYTYILATTDKRAILWPDADDVGREAMRTIAKSLLRNGFAISFVDTSGLTDGVDIADFIDDGKDEYVTYMIRNAAKQWYKTIEEFEPKTIEEEPEPKREYPMTDLGNAERFADKYRGKLLYNKERNTWFAWNGIVWKEDQDILTQAIKDTIGDVYEEHGDKAAQVEGYQKIKNMLSLAACEPGMFCSENDFDNDPYLVVCKNGVVDLRTGTLLKHDPSRLVSNYINLEYNPGKSHEVFDRFMKDITLDRTELIEYLQRWFGVCLSGDTSPQVFTIMYGIGANGKSTLADIIQYIMGGYATTSPSDTLVEKRFGSGIPNDLAGMSKARAVFASETGSDARLDEGRIKLMTGGDYISARFMRGEFFRFKPVWKIMLSTNHKPRIVSSDYGIWRRIVLVPFDYTVPKDKMDPGLADKLKAEAEGIFAWMVEGYKKYFEEGGGRKGLRIPEIIDKEVYEYKVEEDAIIQFVNECCYSNEDIKKYMKPDRVKANVIFKIFKQWANSSNNRWLENLSMQKFYKMMRDHGYAIDKGHGNMMYIMGVYPKEEYIENE